MDLHEYAEDVARSALREHYGVDVIFISPLERAIAHAVADAVADLWADPA